MTRPLLDRIRSFQEYLLEVGVARAVLALPAPRMLALPAPSSDEAGIVGAFTSVLTEPEIVQASRDLFASGHYSLAVQEAYKAVDRFVKTKAQNTALSGTTLMELVFSPNEPQMYWSQRSTESEIDEQKGYARLFSGAMLGIRNPVIHEFDWVKEPEVALELIIFAHHLLRKAKAAVFDITVAVRKSAKARPALTSATA